MATYNFYLRPEMKDTEELAPLYLIYQDRGKKFKHFTGQKIPVHHWDSSAQRVKIDSEYANRTNQIIHKHKELIEGALSKIKQEALPNHIDRVKEVFKDLASKAQPGNRFYTEFESFIEESKGQKKEATVLIYQSVLRDIRRFDTEENYNLDFDKISPDFYTRFSMYLIDRLDNTNNTVSKKIKTLKVFLHYASDKKLLDYSSYRTFKTSTTDSIRVLLDEKELASIFNLNLSMNKDLQVARDLFLFGCFTGLKYSDICNLKPDAAFDNRIKTINRYNGNEIFIPLNNYANMILKRYESRSFYCFPQIKNVSMNKYVKEIAKLAGIDKNIEILVHKGKEITRQVRPKYELITTDTARFSFASISLRAGMRPELLMLILGQKNINSLLQYTIDTNPMKDIEMVNCWNKKVF